ncbi:hypothetical protein BDZ94DRAFT_1259498 [Collybia nuda]|uniref:Uncharacterized protein n=1 Tax=Collybia nuda TaxID=64659 RepID=A0A9P5Y7N7_9AGAR|nr:hypothetical protein BDZ94DRAFT_1259498 [Collybia nuda]
MQRPSLLINESTQPLDALCHHFNVSKARPEGVNPPETFDMPVIRDAHMPSHVLAVYQANVSPTPAPSMLPIDSTLYESGFRVELNLPQAPPGSTSPIPCLDSDQKLIVTLPVVPLSVPHASSLPLLLLFGMGLENQTNLLAWRLLPANVVEEFPNAAAMAQVLSRLREDRFEQIFRYNQGIWKNVLALGLRSTKLVELVQTVWNVTAEARKIRQRAQQRQ